MSHLGLQLLRNVLVKKPADTTDKIIKKFAMKLYNKACQFYFS